MHGAPYSLINAFVRSGLVPSPQIPGRVVLSGVKIVVPIIVRVIILLWNIAKNVITMLWDDASNIYAFAKQRLLLPVARFFACVSVWALIALVGWVKVQKGLLSIAHTSAMHKYLCNSTHHQLRTSRGRMDVLCTLRRFPCKRSQSPNATSFGDRSFGLGKNPNILY